MARGVSCGENRARIIRPRRSRKDTTAPRQGARRRNSLKAGGGKTHPAGAPIRVLGGTRQRGALVFQLGGYQLVSGSLARNLGQHGVGCTPIPQQIKEGRIGSPMVTRL